jgi:hypothetical protein
VRVVQSSQTPLHFHTREEEESTVSPAVYFRYPKISHATSAASVDDVHALLRRVSQLEHELAQRPGPSQLRTTQSPSEPKERGTEYATQSPIESASLGRTPDNSSRVHGQAPSLPSPRQADTTPSSSLFSAGTAQCHFDGYEKYNGVNWYYRGTPIISEPGQRWIASRTGHHGALPSFKHFTMKTDMILSEKESNSSQLSSRSIATLPSEGIAHAALDAFVKTRSRFIANVIDPVLLSETIGTAYTSEGPAASEAKLPSQACVWALLALTSRADAIGPHLHQEPQTLADNAAACLALVAATASLEALQAHMMLVSMPES